MLHESARGSHEPLAAPGDIAELVALYGGRGTGV